MLAIFSILFMTGCTRIETGEVGMRIKLNKTIDSTELLPGSWNQTIIGDVLTFQVKDITATLDNKQPLTADNTALADFDVAVVYNINPMSVAELYTTKSRSFHSVHGGDIFLMHKYVETLVNNASYKAVRQHMALEVQDKRVEIETAIRDTVMNQLKSEGLDKALNLSVVQVRAIVPNQQILQAASNLVREKTNLQIKDTEVEIAKKEAARMTALALNSGQSIEFMNAQARLMIAEGVKAGKVSTIVVPHDFKGFVNVK
jgi:hypothetical protein